MGQRNVLGGARIALWMALSVSCTRGEFDAPFDVARDVEVSVGSLSFGNQEVGTVSGQHIVTVRNARTQSNLEVRAAVAPPFFLTGASFPVTLAPGQGVEIAVTFAPTTPGDFVGSLLLTLAGAEIGYPLSGSATIGIDPPPPDDETDEPSISIVSFSAAAVASPGSTLPFELTIRYASQTPLDADKAPFIHFVSPDNPGWFAFQQFPIPGPSSATWAGDVVFRSSIEVPANAAGAYTVQVGIHDESSSAESVNVPVGYVAPFTETFGAGPIGYRYIVGALRVESGDSTAPSAGNSLQTVIDDMQLDGDYESRRHNAHANIVVGSTAALRAVSRPGRPINFADTVDSLTPWFWVFANPISASSNTGVQARRGECWILRHSTNRWEQIGGGRPSGVENRFNMYTGLQETAEYVGQTFLSDDTVQMVPGQIDGTYLRVYELWFCGAASSGVFGDDLKAIYSTVQARLVTLDPSLPDDRSSAHFTAQLGFDFWNSHVTELATSMKEDAWGNPISSEGGWRPGYPSRQMDGGCARFKWITNEWQSFNVVSIPPKYGSALPPPWGASDWSTANPYDSPPYVITADELRANPPPIH